MPSLGSSALAAAAAGSWAVQLLLLLAAPSPATADVPAFHNDYGFDQEAYGLHPVQKFRSVDVEVPQLNMLRDSSSCETSLYTMLTPRGGETKKPQMTILDHEGHLVWTRPWAGQQIYNLMVQEYRGENYLTFWAGDDTVGGHGAGFIYMLDHNYQLFKRIGAANGLDADLHDFRITHNNTALVTIYEVVERDLAEIGNQTTGPVWDCLFQELDIETGEALFEWRSLDHWNLKDSFKDLGPEDGRGDKAYDYFHINSVDKDTKGNYLVSARYPQSLTYVDGATGETLWILGGKRNMFEDLSGGNATNFRYQHDARFGLDDENVITMFDNAIDDAHVDLGVTRGLRLKLDTDKMTVKVATEYYNPHSILGKAQGSFQQLPNGNVLLGYGDTAAFTEFSHDGEALCDTHFGPEARFMHSDVQSYRTYKFAWTGQPKTVPDAVIVQDDRKRWRIFASWNGSTQTTKWVLQGATDPAAKDREWRDLDAKPRKGFEVDFDLHKSHPQFMRVVAKDSRAKILGTSAVLNGGIVPIAGTSWSISDVYNGSDENWALRLMVALCAFVSAGMIGRAIFNSLASRRSKGGWTSNLNLPF